MYTINRNSSCLGFGIINECSDAYILDADSKSLGLRGGIDVVLSVKSINELEVYDKALIYLDIYRKPQGIPIYCILCSVNIKNIIVDVVEFLEILSNTLNSSVFIDSNESGYVVKPNGDIETRKFESRFIGEIECVFI